MFSKFVTEKLNRALGKGKKAIVAVGLAAGLLAAACQGAAQTVEVEVTREIEVTRQVEIPITQEVEVTRKVPVTLQVEIPVTREIEVTREVILIQEVEVTREVQVTSEVPVTREVQVEVTRQVPVIQVATATPRPTPHRTPTPAPAPSAWTKLSVKTDPLTDEKSIIFYTTATSHGSLSFYDAPTLYVRCNEKYANEVFIHWGGTYMAGHYPNDEFESQVRFDSRRANEKIWSESTNNEATFIYDTQWFIASAKQSRTVFVRVWDFSDDFHDAEFEIHGLTKSMATEPQLCGS